MPDWDLPAPAAIDLEAEFSRALGVSTGRISLRRSWPRDAGHLILEYAAEDGSIIAGQWFADDQRLEQVARETAAAAGRASVAIVPGESVLLQANGADRRLKALGPMLDHESARLLVHRAERRAVVCLQGREAPQYAKLVRPDRAGAVLAANQIGERLAGAAFSTPRLQTADIAAGVTVWTAVSGTPLHDLFGSSRLVEMAGQTGRALKVLHAAGPEPSLPMHTANEEIAWLKTWLQRLQPYAPAFHEAISQAALRVFADLSTAATQPVLIHGDFHDKQVIVDDSGAIGLIDFDTLSTGEAALDVANALVHFDLRALQNLCTPAQAEQAARAFLVGYEGSTELLSRLDAYADATRLRLACLYTFRPLWRHFLPAQLLGRIGRPAVPVA